MARLKIGIFASVRNIIPYLSKLLFSTDSSDGKIYKYDGTTFTSVEDPTPDFTSWTTLTSTFGTSNINSVSYENNIFFAVGASGQLRTSTDGTTWTTRTSNFGTTAINDVSYFDNTWLAVGNTGQIRTSTDAVTWTTRTSNFGNTNINSAMVNAGFVAVGATGQIRYSGDGITWVTQTSNFGNTNIRSVSYGNNLWVAVGNTGQIRYSNDIITWDTVTSNFGNTNILSVTHGNNLWVAAGLTGQIRTSTNAITWTTVTSNFGTSNIESVQYGNRVWIAVGNAGQIRTSTDTITWNTQISNFGNTHMRSVAFGNNMWLLGGDTGRLDKNTLNNSVNQVNKYPFSGVLTNTLEKVEAIGNANGNDITYNNGIWVKATNSAIYSSTDGVTWITAQTGSLFNAIASNDSYYVASSGSEGSTPYIYYSTDSITWTSNQLSGGITGQITSLKYRNGIFITPVASSIFYSSTPPLSGPYSTTITSTKDIEYADGIWCAVGSTVGGEAQIRTSTDLVTWVTRTPNASSTINSIAYNNNTWVFSTSSGEVRYSTDAITWVTSFSAGSDFNRVVVGENGFLLVGTSNKLFASRDGATWTTLSTPLGSTSDLKSAIFVDNSWQIIADNTGSTWGYGIMPNEIYLSSLDQGYIKLSGNMGENWITNNIKETSDFKDIDYISYTTTTSAPSWTTRATLSGYISANSMKHLNGYHVAVGFYDDPYSSLDDRLRLFYSTNGISWFIKNPIGTAAGSVSDISYGQGVWVLVGSSSLIRTTQDLTTNSVWTTRAAGFSTNLDSIDYGDGIWIIAAPASPTNVILRSVDAVTWTSHVSNLGTTSIVIKYGQNLWALGGRGGALATSTNGITWTTRTSNFGTSRINTIEYGNNLWVAGGESGQIRTSTNATTWTTRTSNFGNTWIESIRYGNGVWKAVGRTGQVRTSTNATTWTTETSNSGTNPIFAVAYGNNRWVYANQSGSPLSGLPYTLEDYSSYENFSVSDNVGNILTSTNLTTWTSNSINLGGAFDGGKSLSASLNTSGSISDIHSINSHPNLSTAIVKDNGLVLVKRSRENQFDSIYNSGSNNIIYTTWTSVTSNFISGKGPNAIAYGNGVWVAVGAEGSIRTSTDFITWTTRTSNFGTTNINDINFGNSLWAAVGQTGQIRTSTDGTTWTTRTSNFGNSTINSIVYGDSLWVAGGTRGFIRTSTDAITWTTIASNFGNTTIVSIAYGNSLWVAVANAGQIRTSTNGTTWATQTSNFGSTNIQSVIYGSSDNLWIAVGNTGQIRASTDATTWTTVVSNATTEVLGNIVNVNGVYLALEDESAAWLSANGIAWATWSGNSGGDSFIQYENDRVISASDTKFFYAIPTPATPKAIITDLDDNGSEFLAVASGKPYRTQDFNTLTEVPLIWTTVLDATVRDIEYTNNLWTAVGNSGLILTSTDTLSWTTRTSNITSSQISTISSSSSLYVIGASGQIRTSTDSITWTTRTSNFGNTQINDIAFGNSLFVAAGNTGQIRTSTNGATWATTTSNFGNTSINSVAYDAGSSTWIAVGNTGQIRTSTNGATWATRTSNFGSTNINSVIYGSGLSAAVGNAGQVRTSTNGITWNTQSINTTGNLNKIFFDNSLYVIGSESGGVGVFTSTNAVSWTNRDPAIIYSLAYGDNKWVSGSLFEGTSSIISTTNDLISNNYTVNTVNNKMFADSGGYLYKYNSTTGLYDIIETKLGNISDIAYDSTTDRYVIKSDKGIFESGEGFTVPANSIGGTWPLATINGYRNLTPAFEADITDFEA